MKKIIPILFIGLLLITSIVASIGIAFASAPLEKMMFIHYKRGFARPPGVGKPPKNGDEGFYTLLGKGVKWKTTPVSYVIDPDNPDGLTEEFITSAIGFSAEEWDSYTDTELFYDYDDYDIVSNADVDLDVPDGSNEVLFGSVEELFEDDSLGMVIAVTVVWGIWRGPPSQRKIVEFDIMFDIDYTWGDADPDNDGDIDNPDVMDLQNIATHEFGHGAGLGDLYQDAAVLETMYGYAEYGETVKRDLYIGDMEGIKKLYG